MFNQTFKIKLNARKSEIRSNVYVLFICKIIPSSVIRYSEYGNIVKKEKEFRLFDLPSVV